MKLIRPTASTPITTTLPEINPEPPPIPQVVPEPILSPTAEATVTEELKPQTKVTETELQVNESAEVAGWLIQAQDNEVTVRSRKQGDPDIKATRVAERKMGRGGNHITVLIVSTPEEEPTETSDTPALETPVTTSTETT